MEELNLNESIIKVRVELQKTKIKKSGKNKFAGFDYYELSDFLPKLNELMAEYKINDKFTIETDTSIGTDYAILTLIKGDERQDYKIPFKMFETPISTKVNDKTGEVKQVKSMQDIQYLGALNTYYKRYLYLNAFGITDGEVIDAMPTDEETPNSTEPKKTSTATPKQIELLTKYYKDENLAKLLQTNGISKLEELSVQKASQLISAIAKKKEEVKE